MKKIISLIFCLGFISFAFGQGSDVKVTPDPRLYDVFSSDEISYYEMHSPSKLLELNYWLEGYCYVTKELPSPVQHLGQARDYLSDGFRMDVGEIVGSGQLNSYHYKFPQDKEKYNVFSLGDTGFYVVVYPSGEFMSRKQAYMKQYGY